MDKDERTEYDEFMQFHWCSSGATFCQFKYWQLSSRFVLHCDTADTHTHTLKQATMMHQTEFLCVCSKCNEQSSYICLLCRCHFVGLLRWYVFDHLVNARHTNETPSIT